MRCRETNLLHLFFSNNEETSVFVVSGAGQKQRLANAMHPVSNSDQPQMLHSIEREVCVCACLAITTVLSKVPLLY